MQDQAILIDLIAKCALRNQSALQELYRKVGPYLNKVAYNIVRSDAVSNEVLQDSFVEIWQNAGSYRQDLAQPLTWMTSITRYRALDALAKEKRHTDHRLHDEEDLDSFLSHASTPEKAFMDAQQQQHIMECLETLNDRGKDCISMAYLYGLSREDLAKRFNTNVNSIKSWLHRGTQKLKSCLEQKSTQIA